MPIAGTPNARHMLADVLTKKTMRSAAMGLTLSCIPMNQPLKAISERAAGAAHILIMKYRVASSRTSGVQWTTAKASFRKGSRMATRSNPASSPVTAALARMPAWPEVSPLPKAWAVVPPVPALRKAKFQ